MLFLNFMIDVSVEGVRVAAFHKCAVVRKNLLGNACKKADV